MKFFFSTILAVFLAVQVFGAQVAEVDQIAQQAQRAFGKEDFEGAARLYERLVKLEPLVAEFHSKLGIAYFSSGRPGDAIPPLRQALKLKPSLAQAHSYLGVSLAETGECQEALPHLKQRPASIKDPQLKRTLGTAGLKCAMALDQEQDALGFLSRLERDFPKDPEVLYLSVHVYSDLSTRASQRLLMTAPASYQTHVLNAEALEFQDKWEEAAGEYRRVLEQNPSLPGIHYRLGRLLLTAPKTASTMEDARREFEEELKTDPANAGAEYILGELARQARQWPEAIKHFSRSTELDQRFADAFIGYGKSLVSAGRPAEAIRPLAAAVRLDPENPVPHYQLSFAYRRAGRGDDAEKELLAYRKAMDNARQTTQEMRSAILGRMTPAQTAEAPE